jgi:UDP-N-acetylmuramyl pentapeptide phosphotransferase/UDP-N-acetylglucosamine-1-phosphate transferase
MSVPFILALTVLCLALSAVATGRVLVWLRQRQILDHPNSRSSHDRPTPRGGGLAVVPVVVLCWTVLAVLGLVPLGTLAAVVAASALAILSWRDDQSNLPVSVRLVAQFAAVLVGLFSLPGSGPVFQGLLPPVLDFFATALLWVWFVNLFNFMDGIDGITASETVTIGLGVALIALFAEDFESGAVPLGLSIAAAALGFLAWNWHPAKLFLGDVGSIPLGFLLGWLLLGLATTGSWAPALILPLYYLTDATLTLAIRLARRRRVWEAHREHFYQHAVQHGSSHAEVVLRIAGINLALVLLALMATDWPFLAVALAASAVAGLLVWLLRRPEGTAAQG